MSFDFSGIIELMKNNAGMFIAFIVALVGGIPGAISIYKHFFDYPKITILIDRVDYGSIRWPNNNESMSYIMLQIESINEEDNPVLIPPEAFSLSVKLDNGKEEFHGKAIPWAGTVMYKSENDKSGANIDHLDIQKFTELNVSKLKGVHSEAGIRFDGRYSNEKYYLLSICDSLKEKELNRLFSRAVNTKKFPIKIYFEDLHGKKHKVNLKFYKTPIITSGCYKVVSENVKYFSP